MKFMRATLTFGILCAALAQASAFHIDVISVGTATAGANVTYTENVIFQNTSIAATRAASRSKERGRPRGLGAAAGGAVFFIAIDIK